MDWPDESQWDETTCNMAVCQHPQCWAALRRIERGHPRILGSPCKTLNIEEKPPVLTIVNISDSCFPAKKLVHQQLSKFTFTEAHSLLSQGSKVDAKFQGRPQKYLPDKRSINYAKRSSKESQAPVGLTCGGLVKLPVLNLNKTKLPCPEDVRNMVVIWIPEPEKKVSLAEKTHAFPSEHEKKKRKKLTVENKSSPDHSERQHTGVQSRSPEAPVAPPSSPVRCFEPFKTSWTQVAMLPQDLLRDLLSDGGKSMPSQEMKIQLAMMKKNLPLERDRPESALSSKMFLTIQRLTLQTPTLRHPEHLKKLHYNPQREGERKQQQQQQQQQQRKGKKPTEKQEAEKEATSDPESQTTPHKHSISINLNLLHGPETSEAGATDKDVSAPGEAVLEAAAASGENLSGHMTGVSLDPKPQLLGILQSTDDEDEKNQPSGAQSGGNSLET